MNLLTIALSTLLIGTADNPPPVVPFAIEVVDEATGRGVPLVELTTVGAGRFVTDNAGMIAIYDAELLGRKIYFHVESHGYKYPKDGFGYSGKALDVTPGGQAKLTIKRINIAERLYRVTGSGLYRDSVALGKKPPIAEPLLNAKVFGSDSVLTAVYGGKIRWFWGDTNRPDYPLGNFHTPGAISELTEKGGLDPSTGVNLTYLVDETTGFARPTAQLPGDGPTWLDGLIVLNDGKRERMLAFYAKIKMPMEIYERGLVEWNPTTQRFEIIATYFDSNSKHKVFTPDGAHPFLHEEDGVEYVYYDHPYPLTRIKADVEALKDPANFESYTCLEPGSDVKNPKIDRDAWGKVLYTWKHGAASVGPSEQADLIKAGVLKPHEGLIQLRDPDTGKPVKAHRASVAWNDYRKRWVMIFVEIGGTSFLGEVWYAEADELIGPWTFARKVMTHDKYTFYNPRHHPFFDQKNGQVIYFEGTYANTFSGNEDRTPRYDYNQMMYRLDLADRRVNTPVAVYEDPDAENRDKLTTLKPRNRVLFYALDRAGEGTVPIYQMAESDPLRRESFFALAPAGKRPEATTVPLFRYTMDEKSSFSIDPDRKGEGLSKELVGYVWKDPRLGN